MNELERRTRARRCDRSHWFLPEETALIEALASVIVPSDEDAPGAKEIDVLGYSVAETLDAWVVSALEKQAKYSRGLVALDELTKRMYGSRCVDLSMEKHFELLKFLEGLHRDRSKPCSLFGKLKKRWLILQEMWNGLAPAIELFPMLIRDVQAAFYTSQVSWIWLEYDGPPMPYGYRDLHKPRLPARNKEVGTPQELARSTHEYEGPPPFAAKISSRKQTVDVIVIGSGAGGGVLAKELGEAGLSVIVLEAGKRYNPIADYLTYKQDFEIRARTVFDPEDERRDRYTAARGNWFSYNRVKGVGGSTLQYEAISPRFHESDFRVNSRDGLAHDWPISYAELEPYYTWVEKELGVSGPTGAEGNPFEPPRKTPYPTPPHPFNGATNAVRRGADVLGLHLVREPVAIPTVPWNGRLACIEAGTCHLGCYISAKSSIDVTYVPKAEATGRVEIRPQCMVREITVGPDGRAKGVIYFDRNGSECEIHGRAIVVAGNAVETPRLLLMSTSSRFPNGLANSSGLVGKFFMEHLAVFAYGLFTERLDPWRGIPVGGMIQDYYETDKRNVFARGWTILVSNGSHWPMSIARQIPGWGAEHKTSVKKLFGHTTKICTVGEQLPDARNRIVLNPLVKDNFGLPVPHLINKPRQNDQAMIQAMRTSLNVLLEAAGAIEILDNQYVPGMSSHYMGTCRMGTDPAESVVNPWCRTHDVPNLFIGDGSVFVTSAGVNPALTISALAMRTAEGIVRSFNRHEI